MDDATTNVRCFDTTMALRLVLSLPRFRASDSNDGRDSIEYLVSCVPVTCLSMLEVIHRNLCLRTSAKLLAGQCLVIQTYRSSKSTRDCSHSVITRR